MEINRQMITSLLASDDATLRGKLLEISEVVGIARGDAENLLKDMTRVRALLTMVSDDDVRTFLEKFKR